jgi:PTS system nitrogen regulatory IIA component
MNLTDLLDGRGVELRSAATKPQALAALAEVGAREIGRHPSAVLQGLLEREALGSTGVGNGVALPHARFDGLDRMYGVFVRLDAPVPYDAVDDRPVDLLFALLAPSDAGVEHLRALARVSRLLRSGELRQQLRLARSPDAMFALLTHEARPSAA